MFRRTLVGLVLVLATATSARAQLVVIDPANLYQTILIAERTWQHYQELRRAVRNHPPDVARPGQHGGLPDSDDRRSRHTIPAAGSTADPGFRP